ncbi:HypC/HybG/HupF family hydrogenase formation chaperone [Knoellia sp. p5-6-4]|uniref:HypC/HybG/HupF family hydrogenase formation chaperone n=1 Tax=unclassified Knoellia TaxID=2618719 RepID=UPI0023DBB5F7|nr:HypC/HybG/HupF family hydrogenase formation chaperone [Knoellia sp. p5-6-4]MDF2143459.1 HypC/HybG/HupF family hydrogenase formation chaperone [Knoellia sp. p5-6-4]
MCLGELAEVLEAPDVGTAVVRSSVRTATVSLLTLDGAVAPGDWLLCHSGFALRRLSPQEAYEAAALRSTAPSRLAETTEEAGTAAQAKPTEQMREP